MVRAVHFGKMLRRVPIDAQRLNVVILLFGQIVAANIEFQGPSESDVQNLEAFAYSEDRQPEFERFAHSREFPFITRGIRIFFEHGGIRDWLAKKFLRDVGSAGKQQTISIVERYFAATCVRNYEFGMRRKEWTKPFLILWSNPSRQFRHRGKCVRLGVM